MLYLSDHLHSMESKKKLKGLVYVNTFKNRLDRHWTNYLYNMEPIPLFQSAYQDVIQVSDEDENVEQA